MLAQSGSVAEGLVALGGRVGFRSIVSSGGEVNRDAADFLGWFAADDGTRAVGLFLETIRRPAAFSSALAACAEQAKPVVVLKVGRSAAAGRVALAHTGALVGSARASSAFLRAHGVIEVEDLSEFVEVLEILGRRRWPRGCRIAAVSESGGEAELLADRAEANGLVVDELTPELAEALVDEFPNYRHPHNPLDAWAVDVPERVFPRSLELLAASQSFDVLIAQVDLTQFRSDSDQIWCQEVVSGLAAATAGRDLFGAIVSSQVNDPPGEIARFARQADLALLRGIGAATKSIAAVAGWRPRTPARQQPDTPIDLSDLLRPGALSEHESAAVLERYGIPVAARRLVDSPAAAEEAAKELGFPVVVKVHGPAHKSAIGGVILGLHRSAEVREAARRLLLQTGQVVVARQVPPGEEVMCGMERDPDFGAVVAIGAGGTLAEVSDLSAVALAPLTKETALEMIDALAWIARKLTETTRAQLVEIILALSRLAAEHGEIEELDVNPLVVGSDDVLAVDALAVVSGPPAAAELVP